MIHITLPDGSVRTFDVKPENPAFGFYDQKLFEK